MNFKNTDPIPRICKQATAPSMLLCLLLSQGRTVVDLGSAILVADRAYMLSLRSVRSVCTCAVCITTYLLGKTMRLVSLSHSAASLASKAYSFVLASVLL